MTSFSKRFVLPFISSLLSLTFLVGLFPTSLLAQSTENTETFYFVGDHLGSVSLVLDDEGSVVERRDYLPYGEERLVEPVEPTTDTEPDFTGQKLDEETGLHYYNARYYDSILGRFTSVDPWEGDLTDPQSLNKYAYVLNNPLKYIDPTGENAELAMSNYGKLAALFAVSDGPLPYGDVAAGAILLTGAIVTSVAKITDTFTEVDHPTADNHTGHNVPVPEISTNTGHDIPAVEPYTNTGGGQSYENPANIFVNPPQTDYEAGTCGVNMSCSQSSGRISDSGYSDIKTDELKRMYKEDYKKSNKPKNPSEKKEWTAEKNRVKRELKSRKESNQQKRNSD